MKSNPNKLCCDKFPKTNPKWRKMAKGDSVQNTWLQCRLVNKNHNFMSGRPNSYIKTPLFSTSSAEKHMPLKTFLRRELLGLRHTSRPPLGPPLSSTWKIQVIDLAQTLSPATSGSATVLNMRDTSDRFGINFIPRSLWVRHCPQHERFKWSIWHKLYPPLPFSLVSNESLH